MPNIATKVGNRNMTQVYEHQYLPKSVYGNVISLLREAGPRGGLHLDIGCGYGAVAEPVREELGLTYVGFDIAEDGLSSLRKRGFEVHSLDLRDHLEAERIIRKAADDRPIASLTLIDVLEHVNNAVDVLSMLRRVAACNSAPLVISVPNVTHKDVALKLLIGRWDITEAGLLDQTHVTLYSYTRLHRVTTAVGWREFGARDWMLEHSDQEFPATAPVLNYRVPLGRFLRSLIERSNPHAIVNQFVRLYRIDRPGKSQILEERDPPKGPFLTVLISSREHQAERLQGLLIALAEQTCQDFELILILQAFEGWGVEVLNRFLKDLSSSFRVRTVLFTTSETQRAPALNSAVAKISGRYVAILQHEDRVERHWCATLAELCEQAPGAVLQVGHSGDEEAPQGSDSAPLVGIDRSGSEPSHCIFPIPLGRSGSIADFAIPVGVFHDLGLRFDPEIKNGEDWDLATQAALFCGIAVSPTVAVSFTADGENNTATRSEGCSGLLAKLNANPLLLPAGSAKRIAEARRHAAETAALRDEIAKLKTHTAALTQDKNQLSAHAAVLRDEVTNLTQLVNKINQRTAALRDEIAKLKTHTAALTQDKNQLSAHAAVLRDEVTNLTAGMTALKILYEEVALRLSQITGFINQPLVARFVRSHVPRLIDEIARIAPQSPVDDRPFLSIITRTQGSRIQPLREVLMCLAGQSCTNFELIIVVHLAGGSAYKAVIALIEDLPARLRQRIEVMSCTRAGRAAPLNDAIARARGHYVAVLDDDDLVFAHWVETFQTLAREAHGSILRAQCTRQDFENTTSNEFPGGPRAISWFQMVWPSSYDSVAHLNVNQTPFMSLAFPATIFRDLHLRFDESLNTTEDWDFANRAAMLCGVVSSNEVTSIYRWWTNGESSSFVHKQEEWDSNREMILDKLNSSPILLPAGSVSHINLLTAHKRMLEIRNGTLENKCARLAEQISKSVYARLKLAECKSRLTKQVGDLARANRQLKARNEWMARRLIRAGISLPWGDAGDELERLARRVLLGLVTSTSWRCSSLIRKAGGVLRGGRGCGVTIETIPRSFQDCQRLIDEVRKSTSWRVTAPLRAVGAIARRFRWQ